MAVSRHDAVRDNFLAAVAALEQRVSVAGSSWADVDRELALELFESQLTSRLLDLEARAMKARGEGFYTIGSAGHEGNAAVAACLRPDDICFLHYRSGAFMMQRARMQSRQSPIFDTMLSFAASAEDPASGGRHKVWGSRHLNVPPQTSTIASHLPKAVGAAIALGRGSSRRRRNLHANGRGLETSALSVATFGDASLNHSTAVGAINAALWATHQSLPVPILFVCEDNGIGISVRTPGGWIEAQYASRSGLRYVRADGLELADALKSTRGAVDWARRHRAPVFLHLTTVRLMGHAGSDIEQTYRSLEEIERIEAMDPLIRSAASLVDAGFATGREIRALHDEIEERVRRAAREAVRRPKLQSAAAVERSLAPFDDRLVRAESETSAPHDARVRHFGGEDRVPERQRPRHMAMLINWALNDLMLAREEMLIFGEDVAKKGGVYHVTDRLHERFGAGRVFNTLLDEQTILGMAIGAAHLGYLPCPEIQYLAYLVHASDQLRGEACSLQFFANDAFRNPMVVRVAGLAYQKGFGGHFHNDNGFAFLREIPGLVVAAPARGDDAVGMLRTCFGLAKACGRVVVFLEPIALYMTKDLIDAGDDGWSFTYPAPGIAVPLGSVRSYEAETEAVLTIFTYANGVHMSLRVKHRLASEGLGVRVVDLRWLSPLPREAVLEEARRAQRVLVVDEGRRTGGIGEAVVALLAEEGPRGLPIARVTGRDCYIPLADAARHVLVAEADIETRARELIGSRPGE